MFKVYHIEFEHPVEANGFDTKGLTKLTILPKYMLCLALRSAKIASVKKSEFSMSKIIGIILIFFR